MNNYNFVKIHYRILKKSTALSTCMGRQFCLIVTCRLPLNVVFTTEVTRSIVYRRCNNPCQEESDYFLMAQRLKKSVQRVSNKL